MSAYEVAGETVLETNMTRFVARFTGSLGSSPLTVRIDDSTALGSIVLGGTARIIEADLRASNGIVHVIDSVLIPPNVISE